MTTLNVVQKNSKDDLAIDFLLTSNKNIKKLNYKYRNANKPTNVLSFPMMSIYDGTKFLDIASSRNIGKRI